VERETTSVDQLAELREAMQERRAGRVVVWSAPHRRGEDVEQAVRDLLVDLPAPLHSPSRHDWLLEERGESADGGLAHLDPIDVATARRLLAHVLRFDLAYRTEIMDTEMAARLADRAIDALSAPARWWTNGSIGLPGDGGSWTGLTEATFDTGVIGASPERVLVVWFMDED
jgi:hypothetical protein